MSKLPEVEFKAWPKIPRATGEAATITEKIDGTNSCIVIQNSKIVAVQSRNRFITPDNDNYGFAAWVEKNQPDLMSLGDGYHYGEWAGEGIQKNPHKIKGRKFFLFNSYRWNEKNPNKPACCDVVPVLYEGPASEIDIDVVMGELKQLSLSEGYTAEGVIVYYHNTKRYEKYTYKNQGGKWREVN